MELKLNKTITKVICFNLLIVPYGIETLYRNSSIARQHLLIVPYGIETWNSIDSLIEQADF